MAVSRRATRSVTKVAPPAYVGGQLTPPLALGPRSRRLGQRSVSRVNVRNGSNPALRLYPRHFRLALGNGIRRVVARCISRAITRHLRRTGIGKRAIPRSAPVDAGAFGGRLYSPVQSEIEDVKVAQPAVLGDCAIGLVQGT